MDPVTQGALGAVLSQTQGKRSTFSKAAVIGGLAAMSPDLDVLIRSATDPLLALEFHRHFTHSLFFIPIGALICSFVLHPLFGRRWNVPYRSTLWWCLLGFATHALLDGCTSYGTQLLWPLSDKRFAWDTVSVVDPLVTLPLLLCVYLTNKRMTRTPAIIGMIWLVFYLGFGYVQQQRAASIALELAQQRGHKPSRLEVKPTFGNLIIWKSIYLHDGRFYIDGIKPNFDGGRVWSGQSIAKLDLSKQMLWLDEASQQGLDVARFTWFSDHYVALDTNNANRIVDVRYSMLPQNITPLWGIQLYPEANATSHVEYFSQRSNPLKALQRLLNMLVE